MGNALAYEVFEEMKKDIKNEEFGIDRRNSCENVAKAVQAKHPERTIKTLRDCTWEDLKEVADSVSAEDIQRATLLR